MTIHHADHDRPENDGQPEAGETLAWNDPKARDRRAVTVMFADIADSTSLIERADAETALTLLGPVMDVMAERCASSAERWPSGPATASWRYSVREHTLTWLLLGLARDGVLRADEKAERACRRALIQARRYQIGVVAALRTRGSPLGCADAPAPRSGGGSRRSAQPPSSGRHSRRR